MYSFRIARSVIWRLIAMVWRWPLRLQRLMFNFTELTTNVESELVHRYVGMLLLRHSFFVISR